MKGIIDYFMESREVDTLTLAEAEEALFHIDLHLDQNRDILEVIKLVNLKSKILRHMTWLEKIDFK